MPPMTAWAISSMTAPRVKLGAQIQRAPMRGIGGHGRDRGEGLGFADAELLDQRAGLLGPLAVGVEDAQDVGVADADPGLDVEAGDEPAADDADAEGLL